MKNAKTNGGGQLTAENIRRITEKNPFAKLGDVIYELIENAVLSSAMGPVERINLSKLSEQLGVSTTPVRDALDRLCAKGIVVKKTSEHSKYASYFVFDISNDSISDLYDARKSIECISAAICAQRNWCVDMSQLDRIASDFKKKMDDYAERKVMETSSPSLSSLDRQFHKLIIYSTKNEYLIEMYSSLEKYLDYVSIRRGEFLKRERNFAVLYAISSQHFAIINAIRLGFPEMARSLMEKHIDFCSANIVRNRNLVLGQTQS